MKKLTMAATLLFAATMLLAQDKQSHLLRIQVSDSDVDGTNVNMTVPISALNAFEPMVREAMTEIRVEGRGINLAEIWNAIKDAGPMDYVEVEEAGSHIRVSTTGTHIEVRADGEYEDDVFVSIPFALCDAMFREPDSFDFESLIYVLNGMAGQEIVNINTDSEQIRIWVE